MVIELKSLFSLQLAKDEAPKYPDCCLVCVMADIGVKGKEGSDQFNFYVVTPKYLLNNSEVRWGRGYLLMPEFSWETIKKMVENITSTVCADNWEEAAEQLCKYFEWEFENYQP